jgi:ribokinase
VDLLCKVPRLPNLGETVLGRSFHLGFGGKGANQAVMAARLGARVSVVTKLGRDTFGERTLENFRDRGIDVAHVLFDEETASGVAPILVDDSGRNMIVVIPGANLRLLPADVAASADAVRDAAVLICQLEVPVEATLAAFRTAKESGVMTLLNPAPALPLPSELLSLTDFLIPNETEIETLTGAAAETPQQAEEACRVLRDTSGFSGVLVLTRGAKGAMVVEAASATAIPAFDVQAVDSTGAGDAFVGSLAYYLAIGEDVLLAARRANILAGLSVTHVGTQISFPSRNEAGEAFVRAGLPSTGRG